MTVAGAPAPDRRLLFMLARAARCAQQHANERLLDKVEVSAPQLAMLSYVAANPGCAMTELAELLGMQKSAVTSMVRRLERAGLVKRAPNPDDARGSMLTLTAKGGRLRERSRPVFRAVQAQMTRGFADDEMEIVLRFLDAMTRRFGNSQEIA